MRVLKVAAYLLWLVYLFIFTLVYKLIEFFNIYKTEVIKYNDINTKTKVFWKNKGY